MRLKKWIKRIIFSTFLLLLLGGGGIYFTLRQSLPLMRGTTSLRGLLSTVAVERDARGIATIRGQSRIDIARTCGFLHAQERFFHMDLMRRRAAGELSEIFGASTLDADKELRMHGFRRQASLIWTRLSPFEKDLLSAYTEGVNSGLNALKSHSFEYHLLRVKPQPWKVEDSLLVGLGLFFDLQDSSGKLTLQRGVMKELLPSAVYDFFIHNGSIWEAPIDHTFSALLDIPSVEHFHYLLDDSKQIAHGEHSEGAPRIRGSNQWAVQGSKTQMGDALLACDMHLNLCVPNIWYRVAFEYEDSKNQQVRVDGASLPGTPLMVVGSNRHISWGFTNGYVDTTDIIVLEIDPQHPDQYLTDKGYLPFEIYHEKIKVKGGSVVEFPLRSTVWGPVSSETFFGKSYVIRWVAHDPDAFNMRLVDLEQVSEAKDAIKALPNIHIPVLNFMVADTQGHIGWSLVGSIPNRKEDEGSLPFYYQDSSSTWKKLANPYDYPEVLDPIDGRLWTANNRVVENPSFGKDYLNGIRAHQIKRRLFSSDQLQFNEMISLQLDDEAFFFDRWKTLLDQTLSLNQTKYQPLKQAIDQWDGHCSADSKGYYWIRTFREMTMDRILRRILAPCYKVNPKFDHHALDLEEPLFLLVSQKPAYLVDPSLGSWDKELLMVVDELIEKNNPLLQKEKNWGQLNVMTIQHPLSLGLTLFSRFLDMPKVGISGDYYVPRVAGPAVGASLRMVVTPGQEERGVFNAPCGQSGHPLSPHYRDQHNDWVEGNLTPFLPGSPVNQLILLPTP